MTFRKFRLLMSKYGFSIIIMLLELVFVFVAFFYFNEIFGVELSTFGPILGVTKF